MPFFLFSMPPIGRRPLPAARGKSSGFTLLEVMVVVAILGVLAALAAPSFGPIIERWRVRDSAEALSSTLYYARSEAIKSGGGITIDATGGWNAGWKVKLTQNGASTDLKITDAPNRVTIGQSNSKTILFIDRWGMLSDVSDGAPAAMSMVLYPAGKSATDSSAIRLCIAGGGRIVQMKEGAACPT